jgi:hypothetical protein
MISASAAVVASPIHREDPQDHNPTIMLHLVAAPTVTPLSAILRIYQQGIQLDPLPPTVYWLLKEMGENK